MFRRFRCPPKIIQTRPSSNEDVSSVKYQKNDYLIAARTGYFNQAKNHGFLKLYSEGGHEISSEEIRQIPDLDPTLVKAICIQESHAALTSSDIMTSNNPGDWGDGKLKSAYGMKKKEKMSVTNSLYYGIRILATKGFKGGVKIVTFCIYITICFLIIGCKKSTSTIRDNAYDSVEKYETELEKLCLESHNGSVTYSIRIKTEDLTNDYEYKYLGSLKIKKNNFKVIQQKILSGQYQDSQRAAVSIRLFLKGKLYGEFTGLNNFYKIKITSNTLCLYNYETKSRSLYELKDSIPNLLFFPYNDKDSLSSGDIFYFNRCQ